MGGCVSLNRASSNTENESFDSTTGPGGANGINSATGGGGRNNNATATMGGGSGAPLTIRKNHPLCHETIRWKSDVPLTEGQLRSKRDEFWDTSPAFDGREEIWHALRAATVAAEELDFGLAQAILDGANVSVPNGYLTECYDEFGTQYKVPIYCLSYPINIVKEDNGRDSPAEYSEPVDGGVEAVLKLRLSSTLADVRLPVYVRDTIGQCKKKLQAQEQVDACCQRWFYGGKLLSDKMHVEEAHIQAGYVVQVIVNQEHPNHHMMVMGSAGGGSAASSS